MSDRIDPVELERWKQYQTERRDVYRSRGWLPPTEDGLLTEFGQGVMSGLTRAMEGFGATADEFGLGSGMYDYFRRVRETNHQWDAPPGGNTAHSIGYGVGCASPVLIPLCVIALWYAVWKLRKRAQLRRIVRAEREKREDAARVQAMHELESGNLDPTAKAKAAEQSRGDVALAKSLYLKIRTEALTRE